MPIVVGSWSPSPSTRQRSTLTAEVARYVMLPNDTDAITVAADGINDAIRKYNTYLWQSSLTYQDITLVADTAGYDLSNPFNAPRHAELLDASGDPSSILSWMDPKTFGISYTDGSGSGSPQTYTCYNADADGVLSLNIAPDSSYVSAYPTLRLRYYAKVAYLSNAGDYFDGPSEVESFLCWHAKAYVASIYDPSKAAYADRKADEFWTLLKRREAVEQLKDWTH